MYSSFDAYYNGWRSNLVIPSPDNSIVKQLHCIILYYMGAAYRYLHCLCMYERWTSHFYIVIILSLGSTKGIWTNLGHPQSVKYQDWRAGKEKSRRPDRTTGLSACPVPPRRSSGRVGGWEKLQFNVKLTSEGGGGLSKTNRECSLHLPPPIPFPAFDYPLGRAATLQTCWLIAKRKTFFFTVSTIFTVHGARNMLLFGRDIPDYYCPNFTKFSKFSQLFLAKLFCIDSPGIV